MRHRSRSHLQHQCYSALLVATPRIIMASATYDVGHACAIVSCCPLPAYERLVLAGGEGRLTFLKSTEHEGDDDEAPPVLKRLDMKCELSSTKIDAVAWGHDPVAGELRLASAGGGMLSVHFLNQSLNCEENAPRADFALPPSTVAAGPLRSACFLERAPDRLALTGDTCCAIVLQLAAGHGPVIERTVQLHSPGVAVRTHPREPQQLMIAQEDGAVHFVDLRATRLKSNAQPLCQSSPLAMTRLCDCSLAAVVRACLQEGPQLARPSAAPL